VSVRNVADLARATSVDNIREHKVTFLVDSALLICDLVIISY
jgi:hypothetical protein